MKQPLIHDATSLDRDRAARAAAARALPAPPVPVGVPGGAKPAPFVHQPRPIADVPIAPEQVLPEHCIELGRIPGGARIALDLRKLVEGRLLIQGVSGAGKSWTLRRLLEQSATRIQQIVIDPEGEFKSLAEELGHLYVAGDRLNGAAFATLAERARRTRVSLVLDLSELDYGEQLKAVAAFFTALVAVERAYWTPVLVAVDEAHLFAPFGGQGAESSVLRKAAIAALNDLMARGRKRGLVGVLATQRIARLSKSVVSTITNFLVGLNTLDLDIKRAAETIGWDARKAFDRLPTLTPGHFIACGSAFSASPVAVKVGEVRSRHVGATPAIAAPETLAPEAAHQALGLDELIRQSEEDAEILDAAAEPSGYRAVRAFIRHPAFPLAGRALEALITVAPDGVTVANLAAHLEVPADEIRAALLLLESYGAVELAGEGAALGAPDAVAGLARDLVRHYCTVLRGGSGATGPDADDRTANGVRRAGAR